MGYHRAGFDVYGVDIEPQPNYPFWFQRADALTFDLSGFDAIHASPPCQHWTAYNRRPYHVGEHQDLIGPTREALRATGLPYVIENIPGAPLRDPVQFCGSSLGLDVRRHRRFESNVELVGSPCVHELQTPRFPPATNRTNLRSTVEIGVWRIPLDTQQKAMGDVDWMTLKELSQAIPPAYTEHIGWQLLEQIKEAAA